MMILCAISDALLYSCLALVIGYFSMQLIPITYRPDISFPVKWIRLLLFWIPVLFSLSVIRIVYYLYYELFE